MENLIVIDNLPDHPIGLERKAYVTKLEIYPDSFTVWFDLKYFQNNQEATFSVLNSAPNRVTTTKDTYSTLITILPDSTKTIYENILGLIKAQIIQLAKDGKLD